MHSVVVLHVNAVQALELRDEVVNLGLVQDKDFYWFYSQATYNNDSFTAGVTPRQIKFDFVDPAMATFFKLKWVK